MGNAIFVKDKFKSRKPIPRGLLLLDTSFS